MPTQRQRDVLLAFALGVVLVLLAFPRATVGLGSLVPSAALRRDPVFAAGFPPDPGRTLWDTSGMLVHYPAQAVAAQELRRGRLPLWNPFVGAGAPLLAEAHSTPLSPLLLPFFVHPSETTYTWYLLLRVVLAAAGAFLVARGRGLSVEASALAAIGYAVSGCAAVRFDLPTEGTAYALLPFLVLAAGRGAAVFALLAGLAIYAAHPELAALATLGAVVLAGADAPADGRRWARLFAGAALGAAVGALVALPLVAYAASSGASYKTDAVLGAMFASDLTYVPAAPELLRVGAAPLFFACAAWLSSRRRARAVATARALLAFLVLTTLLVALQAFAPPSVRGLIPPRYALFLIVFAASLLAGEGLDALSAGTLSRRAILGAVAAAIVGWAGADLLAWGRLHRLPHVVAGDLAGAAIVALVLVRPRWRALVPAVTAAALLLSARRIVPAAGEGVPETAAARKVRSLPRAPVRVVGIGPWLDRVPLTPNVATLAGQADVRMVAAIAPARWAAYLEGAAGWRRQPTSFLVERLDAAHLDDLGVAYAIAPEDARVPPGWRVVWRGEGILFAENQRARRRAFVEGGGWADLTAYAPSRVVIDATAPREARVVLTDTFAPGWRAEVDGRPTPIEPFEGVFRAVRVAAGRHEVVMTYRPSSVTAGAWIAGTTTAFLLGAIVWSGRKRRRPTP